MSMVKQIPVGTMANFVYLVVEEKTREAIVVDAGWEIGPIQKAVTEAKADVRVAGGDSLKLGAEEARVIHTPGHTEDSICLYDGSHVFTGDTLLVGTIGRFEREKAREMFTSLHGVILKLPPSTVIFPGHDYGEVASRTLAEEEAANPFLRAQGLADFLALFS
ncbi:MAG: MBL fold metallo-hydrolase [Nitrososphaerota archaeon]|nr:MBL fold metallo-hydrolase [Nitrososphaerota archaeon]MDG7024270.1 MBL fold metallo-hydrolase [Nitrososphaerota archaeon]